MRNDPYAHAPRFPEGELLDPRTLVTGERIELEVGPGRGGFLFERLAAAPEVALLGLEIRRKWATLVDDKLRLQGFAARARVFAEDARFVLPRLALASVSAVFVHFPDPWWKKRHQKRLVIGGPLLAAIEHVLVPGGELFIQTDVPERAEAYEALVSGHPAFQPVGSSARVIENPFGARSPREHRALADGIPIHRFHWRRAPTAPT